jgi:hypothetical protein
MHETRPAKITSDVVTLNDGHLKAMPLLLGIGVIGLLASFILSMFSSAGGSAFERFSFIYLVNFCFVLSISLGCMFFVIISHLTRAGWNVTVRRLAELFAMCAFPLGILFLVILLPVLMGYDFVYPWNQSGWSAHSVEQAEQIAALDAAAKPPIEQLKGAYLNPMFFSIRAIAYFLIWGAMGAFFLKTSLKQDDSGDVSLTKRMQALSAPLLILFAVTIVFSSFDFEMSLSPLWFSTMFPVYFFAGAFMSGLITITLTAMWLQKNGRVTDEITTEHYHDLGKLTFGFVVFWGYIAFSQFLLIWYANIPEETFWYDYRINTTGWGIWSLILVVGHLFIPFLAIMGRTARRNRTFLAGAGIFLLVMHWVDHYWLIMPQMDAYGHVFTFNPLVDIPCAVGMIAIYIAIFCFVAKNRPLVPLKDPRLGEALNHAVH